MHDFSNTITAGGLANLFDVVSEDHLAIMSASPGGNGGLRGLMFLRMLLSNIGVLVLPEQLAVPHAFKAFSKDGSLTDDKQHQAIENIGAKLTQLTKKING
ncbi:MAG: hypothetical protein ABGY08_08565 [Gammaproteobacteria bacterium]